MKEIHSHTKKVRVVQTTQRYHPLQQNAALCSQASTYNMVTPAVLTKMTTERHEVKYAQQ